MAAFLLQKFQHPVDPTSAQGCMLLQPYDVITVQDDGWAWGDQELAHPWFRILLWPGMATASALPLLDPAEVQIGSDGKPTLWRLRKSYLNMGSVLLPLGLPTWWADDTRANPTYSVVNVLGLTLSALQTARPLYPDPAYS